MINAALGFIGVTLICIMLYGNYIQIKLLANKKWGELESSDKQSIIFFNATQILCGIPFTIILFLKYYKF